MAHILVVEDSFFIRQSLQLMLREAAYGVTVTGDGALGLAKAREIKPDLVILDLMLPSTPGTTVLQELKLDPKTREIPVLVLSGLAKSNENALKRLGATSFCEKSLLQTDLLRIIKETFAERECETDIHGFPPAEVIQ